MSGTPLRVEQVPRHPLCRGQCKGDRGALESPAVLVKIKGKDRVGCPCCGELLRLVQSSEGHRPPNLAPGLAAQSHRFHDRICDYDVVILLNLQPT